MKYAITRIDGVAEIREDTLVALPVDAVELTDSEYDSLMQGAHILSGKFVVPNPNPSGGV